MKYLLLISFCLLMGSKAVAQKSDDLRSHILEHCHELGISKKEVLAYFMLEPFREICRDTSHGVVHVLSYTSLVYSGGRDMMYLEHEIGEKPDELYLILGKTPYLSLKSRLHRNGFKQLGHNSDWTEHKFAKLRVDLYFREAAVMDVYRQVKMCLGKDFEINRYTVAIFSLYK